MRCAASKFAGMMALSVALAASASADSLQQINSQAAQFSNDSIAWSQLGPDQAILGATLTVNTALARQATVGLAGPNSIISVACGAAPCSWTGTGPAAGDSLLWASDAANGGNGPITLTFSSSISGGGALIQANLPGPFTAKVEAFNGNVPLGSFTSPSDAGGDALYLGVLDQSGANITSLVFSLTACGPDDVSGCTDFAIDTAFLSSEASTTTTAGSSPNPSVFGQAVTIMATVTSAKAGTPAGTVTFFDGANDLGMANLSGAGTAAISPASLTVGAHTITATYTGDMNFSGSTSAALVQTVNTAGSSVSLGSSLNPSNSSQQVTFTATVAVIPPGAGTVTGNVNFADNGAVIHTSPVGSGVVSFSTAALDPGVHPITATYAGDLNFSASTSNTVQQTVNPVAGPNADLSIQALSHLPAHPASIGGKLMETVTVSNAGPDNVSTITLTIDLTGNFILGPLDMRCSGSTTITCDLGALKAGQNSVVHISLTPRLGRQISVDTTVTGNLPDNLPSNNLRSDSVAVRFKPQAR